MLRYFVKQRAEEVASGKLRRARPRRPAPTPPSAAAAAPSGTADVPAATGQPPSLGAAAAGQLAEAAGRAAEEHPSTSGAAGDEPWDGKIRILEGLAASGLRSIRYALEVHSCNSHSGDAAAIFNPL